MKTNLFLGAWVAPQRESPCQLYFTPQHTYASWILSMLLLVSAVAGQAEDYDYTTNGGTITITWYTGPGGDVVIPNTIIGLPVTGIGEFAFWSNTSVTSVAIPDSVISIGGWAFVFCTSMVSVTIPDSVTIIGQRAFYGCSSLNEITVDEFNSTFCSVDGVLFDKNRTILIKYPDDKDGNYAVPNSVTNIGDEAFLFCSSLSGVTLPNSVVSIGSEAFVSCYGLTNITIPESVTSIGNYAFQDCINLTSAFFKGDCPIAGWPVFMEDTNTTVYYLPGTTGWTNTFGGRLTVLWNPQMQTSDGSFGVGINGFKFNITGTTNIPIVIEACTNLNTSAWVTLQSCTLTNSALYFKDPSWTNYPARLYRIRSPL